MRIVTYADTCDDTACVWLPVNNVQTALMRKWSTVRRNMFPDRVSVQMTVGNCVLYCTEHNTYCLPCYYDCEIHAQCKSLKKSTMKWKRLSLVHSRPRKPWGASQEFIFLVIHFLFFFFFLSKSDLNCFLPCVNDLRAVGKIKCTIKMEYQEYIK